MIYTNTLETCKKCGVKCCKPSLVSEPFDINLQPGDFTKIVELGAELLIDTVLDPEEGLRFIITPHIFGYCPFLNYWKQKCTIYSSRPSTCKRFPYDSQIKTSVKNQCPLWNSLDSKRIANIEEHYVRKFQSEKFIKEQKQLDALDAFTYTSNYSKRIDDLMKVRNTRLVNNSQGSFLIKSYTAKYNDQTFESILGLLHRFRERITQEQLILDILVIDKQYSPIFELQGVLGVNNLDRNEIFQVLASQDNYYEEKFDGSFIKGVFYLEELYYDWGDCWNELYKVLFQT
ncbi:MAG: YkgJ family cysteine cluster protein [Candidatus Hodarchaeales archaeon]